MYRLVRHFDRYPEDIPPYSQVVVDEYQDFSALEVLLIDQLSSVSPMLVVGGDDQALSSSSMPRPGTCATSRREVPTSGSIFPTAPGAQTSWYEPSTGSWNRQPCTGSCRVDLTSRPIATGQVSDRTASGTGPSSTRALGADR